MMCDESVYIAAVGDVMLGDRPLMVGLGVRSYMESSNVYDPFYKVGEFLKKQDVVFGNLESVLSDYGLNETNYKSVQMRGSSKSVTSLINAGFNVMSVANNHIMQHGDGAFYETIELLKNNRIDPIGCVDSYGKSLPRYKKIKEMTLGFVGFSMKQERYASKPNYALVNFSEILKCVKEYKKECDYLVVSLHWGDEYVSWPSKEQISQARSLSDNGASLILGHHPHVIQGIEKYNNSIIAYSLGNFVFDVWQKRLRQTYILVVSVNKNMISEFKRIPIYIDQKYRPQLLAGDNNEDLNNIFTEADQKINDYPHHIIPVFNGYSQRVKINDLRNKIENRMLFCWNFFKYKSWIRRQSILGFIEERINFK